MGKHILDHDRPASAQRALRYLDIARTAHPHGSIRSLIRRPRGTASERRFSEFLRLGRRKDAEQT